MSPRFHLLWWSVFALLWTGFGNPPGDTPRDMLVRVFQRGGCGLRFPQPGPEADWKGKQEKAF